MAFQKISTHETPYSSEDDCTEGVYIYQEIEESSTAVITAHVQTYRNKEILRTIKNIKITEARGASSNSQESNPSKTFSRTDILRIQELLGLISDEPEY